MTLRALGLILGGGWLVALGWDAGWPESTAMGAALIALVLLSMVVAGRAPRVEVALDQAGMKVVRGQPATVRMTLQIPRRRWRWLRVVEGSVSSPVATSPLGKPDPAGGLSLKLPVDTSVRGERPIGPYSVVHGDPWSLVRRVAARAEGGILTVYPRTVAVRRSALPMLQAGDSVAAGRRRGDEHFYALREYVLGDEPRMVHWRSSARAGKLVVMQQVAPAPNHTMIILDADASAYGHDDKFAGGGLIGERFENAVDVAASLAIAQADRVEQVHAVTTARGAALTSAGGGMTDALLTAFAAVRAVPPVDTAPHEVVPLVRRTRCQLVVFVTGTPSVHAVSAMRAVAGMTTSFTVVRVGSRRNEAFPGLRVFDVEGADDLVAA
jgi:uncharacterized protein (DUF58 family)